LQFKYLAFFSLSYLSVSFSCLSLSLSERKNNRPLFFEKTNPC
jgi:hypothetical protein